MRRATIGGTVLLLLVGAVPDRRPFSAEEHGSADGERWTVEAAKLIQRGRHGQAFEELASSREGRSGDDPRLSFLLGYTAFQSGNDPQAERYLGQSANSSYILRSYSCHYLARHYFRQGRYEEALEMFRMSIQLDPHHPLLTDNYEGYLETAEKLGLDSLVAAVSLGIGDRGVPASRSAAFLLRGGRALVRLHRMDEAVALLDSVLQRGTNSREAYRAARDLERLMETGTDRANPDLQFRMGEALYEGGDYGRAEAMFRASLRNSGDSYRQDRSRLYLARTCARRRDYGRAEREYVRVIRDGGSQWSHMAGSQGLAQLQLRTGRLEAALATLEAAVDRYPEHELADDLLWDKARACESRGRREAAIESYRSLVNLYPGREFAEEGLWQIGFLLYLSGRPEEALREFDRGLTLFPRGAIVMKFAFWRGKILQQTGRTEEAAAAYWGCISHWPDSYYGHRARHALEALGGARAWPRVRAANRSPAHDGWDSAGDGGAIGADPGAEEPPPFGGTAGLEGFERGVELTVLGLTAEATGEFRYYLDSTEKDPDRLYRIARRFNGLRQYSLSVLAADMAARSGRGGRAGVSSDDLARLMYPRAFSAEVAESAAKFDLDPDLVYALMREESLFDPTARSSAGATGLMQLMYHTARGAIGAVGLTSIREGDLEDPSINILLGSWFISHQLKRFDDNPILAVAAYNGGPTNVRRWLRRSPDDDIDLFLETIPYPETKSHVRKVFRTYQMYKDLGSS